MVDHLYSSADIELGEEVEIELPLNSSMENDTIPAVEIIESQTDDCPSNEVLKSPQHHRGPINIGYVHDRRARQKCLSKRLKTFKSQALALHNMCGAQVMFKVVAESGKRTTLSLPPCNTRHVMVQAGESNFACQTRQVASSPPPLTHTPKKSKVACKINHMPGKKAAEKKSTPIINRVNNKCSVCTIIFNSKSDKTFRKRNGRNGIWIGCDHDGCQYWAHAVCAGQKIKSLKSVPTIKFFCPAHQ